MTTCKQLCTFKLCDQWYGVPVNDVQEVIKHQAIAPVPLATPFVVGLMNLRGQMVTVVDLKQRLQIPHSQRSDEQMNLIVRAGEEAVSLLVDQIGDVQVFDPSSIDGVPAMPNDPSADFITGVAKADDAVLMILDTKTVVQSSL